MLYLGVGSRSAKNHKIFETDVLDTVVVPLSSFRAVLGGLLLFQPFPRTVLPPSVRTLAPAPALQPGVLWVRIPAAFASPYPSYRASAPGTPSVPLGRARRHRPKNGNASERRPRPSSIPPDDTAGARVRAGQRESARHREAIQELAGTGLETRTHPDRGDRRARRRRRHQGRPITCLGRAGPAPSAVAAPLGPPASNPEFRLLPPLRSLQAVTSAFNGGGISHSLGRGDSCLCFALSGPFLQDDRPGLGLPAGHKLFGVPFADGRRLILWPGIQGPGSCRLPQILPGLRAAPRVPFSCARAPKRAVPDSWITPPNPSHRFRHRPSLPACPYKTRYHFLLDFCPLGLSDSPLQELKRPFLGNRGDCGLLIGFTVLTSTGLLRWSCLPPAPLGLTRQSSLPASVRSFIWQAERVFTVKLDRVAPNP
ncbi:uncharacterized protein LOC128928936 [Callithrix jacchus]